MNTAVVTSCSAQGWTQYGRRFVETFCAYWPREVVLHVYSEDLRPANLGDMLGRDLGREVFFHDLRAPFLDRHAGNLRAQGREQHSGDYGWTPNKVAQGYNFRLDAFRFSKKVFAIQAAARCHSAGWLCWVDADVVTFDTVPPDLLERMLPADAALSCLDRGDYHSECGFVCYNLDHPATRPFIEAFAALYETENVFQLKEWHDSWVFDWLRKKMQVPVYAIPHCSNKQPFINSELGCVMDHLKGASKIKGKTLLKHMLAGHAHAYWSKA